MILRTPRGRSGITLTEILISILILGVGMVSLATLFPLGLLRLREANRLSRSGTLTQSATGDIETRDLFNKSSFLNSNYSPWYSLTAYTPRPYDPWVQDTPSYRADPWTTTSGDPVGVFRGEGPTSGFYNPVGFQAGQGLPVAYDPLWRYQTGIYPGVAGAFESRFASGIGFVRPDPAGGDPSAHGLQRLTNFSPFLPVNNPRANAVPDVFVSPDDIVLQSDTTPAGGATLSPIVPEMFLNAANIPNFQNDWKYTWMFTGQQADCTNGATFAGDIVVFESRPCAVEPVTAPFSTTVTNGVAGETVVEAIFGYTGRVSRISSGTTLGYGSTANRAVLLRWPSTVPDPEIRAGGWIADVTYEREAARSEVRAHGFPATGTTTSALAYYPYQRCHWYQIAKRTPVSTRDPAEKLDGDPDGVSFREMTVWVNTPLKALTLLSGNGSPYHVNAALVSPYVVNVFPRTIYTR